MVINIKNICWTEGNKHILKNITWEVYPGEHWAIIGLNGSGKTSLLNMLPNSRI
jgi:iron complex transport system ATP-binding protein